MSAFFQQSSLFSDAAQQTDGRFLEERAHHHSERLLQRRVTEPPLPPVVLRFPTEPQCCSLYLWKVLQAWRRATMCAVSQRRQQGGAAVDAPGSANQGEKLHYWSF